MARAGRKVIFLDTEGVSIDRLRQVSGSDFDTVAKNILFSNISNFDDQERMVDKAIKLAQSNVDVGMIIIDTISMDWWMNQVGSGQRLYSHKRHQQQGRDGYLS